MSVDHRRRESCFAIVSPGLEEVCAGELNALGLIPEQIESGGVSFNGQLSDLYLANLWLRTATRVVVRLGSFRSRDFPDLYRKAVRLPWGRFLGPKSRIRFRITSRRSRLGHSGRISEVLTAAANRSLGRTMDPASEEEQLVLVRIVQDQFLISIDSSGELLHRRGYRPITGTAPLRETLAAGILILSEWSGSESLYDPMCGSGTFLIEGGLLASHQAPGLHRSFAFMNWPGWREGLWRKHCHEALKQHLALRSPIAGSDCDERSVAAAKSNLRWAGLEKLVTVSHTNLMNLPSDSSGGLVVLNPPYGLRLENKGGLHHFYKQTGKALRRVFPGWRCALLSPHPGLVESCGLKLWQAAILDNGGLQIGLYRSDCL